MVGAGLQDAFGLAGTVLEGQYRVDRVVGEGGFGVVYRGQHLSLDQPVAIKVLKGLDGGDPKINALILEKFRAEARLLYTLSQTSLNIVRALHFSAITTPSGAWAPFMVLEWLEGQPLDDELARRGGGRSVKDALPILTGVAEALSVAHRHQVAHRDIKPANVFLVHGPEGQRVKVLDFGIAKIMKEGEAAGTKGTFASFTWLYAAPEQLDPRLGQTGLPTDVYAFGLLVTELLTGRPPMDAPDVIGIMRAAMDTSRRPTPRTMGANVTDEIEAICRKALAVNPGDRYPSIVEMWTAFSAAAKTRSATTMQRVVAPPSGAVNPVNPLAATGVAGPMPPSGVMPPSAIPPGSGVNPMAATGMAPPSAAQSAPANIGRPSLPSAAQWTPPPPTPPGYGVPQGYAPPQPPPQQWGPPPPPMGMQPQHPQWVQRLPIRPPESMSQTAVIVILVLFVVLVSGSCAMCSACLQLM
ncbi:MAG: protein kinase [Labilithrix sp.]